jgi:asparagine synthase (glutamine-hydrolysing)
MCGLAGLIAWDDRCRVDDATLARMSGRIAHRGPDGEGIVRQHPVGSASAHRPHVTLIHRRLAILDPDPRANQPFSNDAGQTIVFNGEIYNFRDLHRELSRLRPDYAWRTTCDTEVLLLAYSVWKEACLERLEGMFAFAIYDAGDRSLFLARDRMGQKPMFYAHRSGEAFAFASEIPALLELAWVGREIDEQGLADYLSWGYVSGQGTIYRAVHKLEPGCWMRVGENGIEPTRWFWANNPPRERVGAEQENIARARELILGAVRRQLVSDVPLGCFLSGGMDSSIIAAAMRAAVPAGQPVLTFSIGFEDRRYDETQYAAEVARHLGTNHHQFIVRPDAAEDLPKLAAVFGEPFGDSSALPTHYLARETRGHVKVALSGDGGDELFGGYERYRAMQLGERVGWMGSMPVGLGKLIPGSHPKARRVRLRRFLKSLGEAPARRYAGYVGLFGAQVVMQLLGERAEGFIEASQQKLVEKFDLYLGPSMGNNQWARDVVQAALATDRDTYLPEDLLAKVDRCSMLHALEVRSPFMDHELVHFAAALPSVQLLPGGGKRLLRRAFGGDLPNTVFTRKKMGFAVPIGEWFQGSLRGMLSESLFARDSFASGHLDLEVVRRLLDEHIRGKEHHSQRLYALLMLELWWREHGAGRREM